MSSLSGSSFPDDHQRDRPQPDLSVNVRADCGAPSQRGTGGTSPTRSSHVVLAPNHDLGE